MRFRTVRVTSATIASVPGSHDEDDEPRVFDTGDDAEVAGPVPPERSELRSERLAHRARIRSGFGVEVVGDLA